MAGDDGYPPVARPPFGRLWPRGTARAMEVRYPCAIKRLTWPPNTGVAGVGDISDRHRVAKLGSLLNAM